MDSLGRHLLAEFYNCNPQTLNSIPKLRRIMLTAAKASSTRVINHLFHRFSPSGISGVIVIAESHLAIHTWPEYKFASVDIYTCGSEVDPWKAYEYLIKQFKTEQVQVMEIRRGNLPKIR